MTVDDQAKRDDVARVLERRTVGAGSERRRLSDFVAESFVTRRSRKGAKKAIKRGEILVDGRTGRTGDWTIPGMVVEWIEPRRLPLKPYRLEIPVVVEDDHLAVIDKPGGLRVGGNQFRNLENVLLHNLTPSTQPDALRRFRPVHRLDAATRGLVAVAKTSSTLINLSRQFERREVFKRYRAVVIGDIQEEGEFNDPLDGREAITRFRRVARSSSPKSGWLSLVDLYPKTGRTHQLRRHLSLSGHPILGDREHGIEHLILKGKGLFLCAVELSFEHPVERRSVTTVIQEPAKFSAFMNREARRM